MAMYSLEKLRQLWKQEELTVEQMLGQRSAELTPKPPPTSGNHAGATTSAAERGAHLATRIYDIRTHCILTYNLHKFIFS